MSKKINYRQTPSQTVGPYFAYGLTPEQYLFDFKSLKDNHLAGDLNNEDSITIEGQVFDGNGESIQDAMIEIWQNDGEQEHFGRFGTGTEAENKFKFHTVKPKSMDGQAPYLSVIVFMRGQLLHSYTRIYFEDETALNESDQVLASIPADRRHTLIAKKTNTGYRFDIYMQGAQETVFFEI